MNKTILVIGAGIAQIDAIKKAKDLGCRVLASDGSPTAVGLAIADEARVIDVIDVEGNLAWACQAKIDGVISYATDIALPTVLAIREALNLPGLGRAPMEVSLDKSLQRELFKKTGLPQPPFEVADNLTTAQHIAEKIGFPLVIKPVDNSGSRGVTLVEGRGQLADAYRTTRQNTLKGKVILEKYMEGTELTVEGFSVGGRHHVLAISDKFKPESAFRVATQLAYPAAITPLQEKAVCDLISAALDVAGVDNTPTHSEIMMTDEGPQIVEIGCRGGGFYVFTKVVEAASGYDIVGNWTRMCVGIPVEEITPVKRGVVLRFYAASPGRLVSIDGIEEANAMDGVETGLFLKPGDIVPELKTDGSRTGWMVVRGRDRAEAVGRADRVSETVTFTTEPV